MPRHASPPGCLTWSGQSRDGRGALVAGVAEEREVEEGLDGAQQGVVSIGGVVAGGFDGGAGDDGGYVAAGGQVAAAAAAPTGTGAVALVPGDHQAGVLLPGRGAHQSAVEVLQPAVGRGDQGVVAALAGPVHVVVQVRGDEHQAGQAPGGQVGVELGERHHLGAPAGVVADAGEVQERVVLLGVRAGQVSVGTGCGQALHVRLPGDPGPLQLVGEVGGVQVAAAAVAGDPLGATADHGDVVGQRRVGDG